MYTVMNRFIQQPQFVRTNPATGPVASHQQDIENLRAYLLKAAGDRYTNLILSLSDAILNRWIEAALSASSTLENESYVLEETEEKIGEKVRTFSHARVLVNHFPSKSVLYSHAVHQLLHSQLELK